MISDTLYEALAEIERYQKSIPKCYDGLRDEIGKVKAVMNALRAYLDLPPSQGRYPKYDAAMKRLRNEIAAIAVDGLSAAIENVTASWPTQEEFEATKDFHPSRPQELDSGSEQVFAPAVPDCTQDGNPPQPCNTNSDLDSEKHEVCMLNLNGLLARSNGLAGELRPTDDSEERA